MNLKYANDRDIKNLKNMLFEEFKIKECIFEEKEASLPKKFSGVYEGRTKFFRKTIRSGQRIDYPGNVVIIGDVNYGAEVYASGNIIVFGHLKGCMHAGIGGNDKAIITALCMQPQIIEIAGVMTRSPEDKEKPEYPEVAKLKDGCIMVEPYVPNKYI
jgi:septum site-determining protein MinC